MIFFVDDILVYSNNEEEYVEHREAVLRLLREHQLYSNLRSAVYFNLKFITWDMLFLRKGE